MLRTFFIRGLYRWSSEVEKSNHPVIPKIGEETIFDKIIRKELPGTILYEDDLVIAFKDIAPKAPVHILLIPKIRNNLINLTTAEEKNINILGYLLVKAAEVAKQEKLDDGWRLVINNGVNACQSVYHLHLHILGGKKLDWTPG